MSKENYVDLSVYHDIGLRWFGGRLVLSIGNYELILTPEQLRQFREALKETKVLKK